MAETMEMKVIARIRSDFSQLAASSRARARYFSPVSASPRAFFSRPKAATPQTALAERFTFRARCPAKSSVQSCSPGSSPKSMR